MSENHFEAGLRPSLKALVSKKVRGGTQWGERSWKLVRSGDRSEGDGQ